LKDYTARLWKRREEAMPKIVPIVEGYGEVDAVPNLLRKLLQGNNRWDIQVATPKNAHGCTNLIKPGGLERFVQLAGLERDCAVVLILMDADERCPKELAFAFSKRIQAMGAKYSVVIVIAKCEYEAWFLASLETLAGQSLEGRPGLPVGLQYAEDVEKRVGVKGWLSRQFPEGRIYKETEDQAPMARLLDVALAKKRSRSFRRLTHAIEQALRAVDTGAVIVTPEAT
jgi:hypothetical protein